MLLLSCEDELDACSVELLTSFIKGRTEGVRDVTTAGPFEDKRLEELEDTQTLLYALREVAESSEDPESVRVAFIALTSTDAGQSYLKGNPIKL